MLALAIPPVFAFLAFYFLRSSKEMPKNWRAFVVELRIQTSGAVAFVEDMVLRYRNRVELLSFPNKIAVITGGNRGIGLHVVEKLLKCDMKVVMGVRSPEASQKSVETALGKELTQGKIFYEKCDTGDMKSVEQFAEKVKQKFSAVHLLINNAGVMCVPYQETKDGFESHMAINHLGHFLLTHLLMPQLIAGSHENGDKNVRIVNVSSCVHRLTEMDYDDFHTKKFYYPADAYNKSKLAQVFFTNYLENLFTQRGLKLQVNSVHPGVVDTELFANSSTDYIPWIRKLLFKTADQGSQTIMYAAISPKIEGKGGKYLSNCMISRSHHDAENNEECKKLFEFTCKLLSIKNFGNLN